MAHDPVHLFMGLYDFAEAAERDFHDVVSLHGRLVGATTPRSWSAAKSACASRTKSAAATTFWLGSASARCSPCSRRSWPSRSGSSARGPARSCGTPRAACPGRTPRSSARLSRTCRSRGRGQRQDGRRPTRADAAGGPAARRQGARHRQGRVRRRAATGGGRGMRRGRAAQRRQPSPRLLEAPRAGAPRERVIAAVTAAAPASSGW